ncbi:hypothetical protein ACIQPT_25315 [Streptomyces sp. NPDC091289]|uniref:hypothetical protein n=1 Tax=Streptomyces sp. NPDC091289 TaxID=3365989 RepID=UPI0037FE6763
MLTYQDVVTTKLDSLTTAADKWVAMAKAFKEVEDLYKAKVQPLASDGGWYGLTADSASAQFKATRAQLQGAQTEAKAIASLLRDAHTQFVRLCKVVTDTVAKAIEDDMSIDSQGKATYDFSKIAHYRNDPDYQAVYHEYVRKRTEAEAAWTRRIKAAVQAVDDADQGAKLALRKAAGVKTGMEKAIPSMAQHGFNNTAVGDIEIYEAREAKAYADTLLDDGKLTAEERANWERLNRDNADNKKYSQTLLNSLGIENTIKLENKLSDLGHFGETGNRKDYQALERGLANTLAGATRVPEFKDSDGKKIPYGANGYQRELNAWKKSDDAAFYNGWREGMQKVGVKQFNLEIVGEKVPLGSGYGQQARGYQSLISLMQQGDGYSPQFLADVTDDMIAAESNDKDVWDLIGLYNGKEGGWFANDPVDGALQIMARDPEAATGYLDPGSAGRDAENRENDRLRYLMDRETNIARETGYNGKNHFSLPFHADVDDRAGLGAAIEAAATGSPSGSGSGRDGTHTVEQARVMQDTISLLDRDRGAESVPARMHSPLARALADYAPDTHNIFSEEAGYDWSSGGEVRSSGDEARLNVSLPALARVLRGVAEDPADFALLYEAERFQGAQGLGEAPEGPGKGTEEWDNPARSAASGLGALNAIGADIILDDRDNRKDWADDVARYGYHVGGAPLTMIPVVGDAAQRLLDVAAYEWSKDIKAEADQIARVGTTDGLMAHSMASHDLINQWAGGRGMDYMEDSVVKNMRGEASQSYGASRNVVLGVLGRGTGS